MTTYSSRRKFIGDVSKLAAMLAMYARRGADAQVLGLPFFAPSKSAAVTNGLLNGLLAYWKFDDTTTGNGFVWVDATGNGFGATQSGVLISSSASGIINGCCQHAGVDSSALTVSASLDGRASSTPFTFSLWFNDNGATGASQAIFEQFYSLNSNNFPHPSKPQWVTVDDSSTVTTIVGATALNWTAWNHVVCGYDGTHSFLIVNNGTKVTGSPANVKRSAVLHIVNNFGNTGGWPGSIDEMGYWNRDLTSNGTDVPNLYNGGAALAFSRFTT